MAIIGVDEAGKGPVIGSMFVVAARIRSERDLPNNVLDSKKLTPKLREEIAKELVKIEYFSMGVQEVTIEEIDRPDSNMNISNNVNPNNFSIKSIYPNPFNPSVNIEFEQSELSVISANIYNLNGQLIEHLFSGFNNIGSHNIIWNASDYPSGIYFIQIKNQSRSLSQKLMLIK